MADVNKIPGAAPEPARSPREPTKPGTEKFRDLMKVDKPNDQQKKKKKRQEQAEEETKAELTTGALTPEKALEGTRKPEKFPKIQKVAESEKRQPQQQKRAEEAAALEEEYAVNLNRKKIEAFNLEEVESTTLEKPGKAPIYTGEAAQKQTETEEEAAAVQKKEEHLKISIGKREKKEAAAQPPAALPAATAIGPSFIAPATTTPGYLMLSSDTLALFEKMVSLIMVMQAKGDTETIIHLNTPEFSNSAFAGAQISIKEFSTAPYVYNIEFIGDPQNVALFNTNSSSLRAAFDSEKRSYTINRIEGRLKSEKPHFHRKEKPSKREQEER